MLLVYLDALLKYRTQWLPSWSLSGQIHQRARVLRERSKLLKNLNIWWPLTGQYPKLCSAPCRISQREFSSAWPTSLWHVAIAIWSLYMVESNLIPYLHCVLLQCIYSHYSPTAYWSRQKMRFHVVRRGVLWVTHRGNLDVFIVRSSSTRPSHQPDWKPTTPAWKQIRDRQTGQKGGGKASNFNQKPAKGFKKHKWQLLCFKCGRSEGLCNCIRPDGGFEPTSGARPEEQQSDFKCRLSCCKCSYCHWVAAKERRKSQCMSIIHRNKICERCFLCRSLAFCKSCHQCSTCCFRSSCRGEVKPVLGEMGNPGFKSKSGKHSEGGLHAPLPVQTPLDKVTDCNKQLPQSNQTVLPFRGTVSADKQKCSRTGGQSKFTGVLQLVIFGTQTQQPVETHPRPEHLEHLFKHRVVQDGDTKDHKNLPPSRGVGHIHRFQRCILPYTHSQSVQEVHALSPSGSVLPVQSPSLWPFHSSHGVHSGGQRGQTHGTSEGYKDPPVLRRLAGESLYPPHLSPAYSNPSPTLSGIRVAGEQGKVRAGSQTGLQLRRLPVRPERGQGQTNRRTLADLDRQDQINNVRSGFMSLIGLLTATEKQVHLGRLHMRPIQWHLKNNWRVPESLEKVIPVPKSLHPHLRWWLEESNVLLGQPLHPLKHALQIFTDASNEGWGAHLDDHTARGTWSLPESKLHINHLELKAVFLALKEFRTLVFNKTVLVATDNTTVVAYINKEGGGGMKSGSLCALLWRILSWCTRQQVTLRARHIPGQLNVIADKLSRLGQTIQTEWSLHPAVFQAVCSRWHQPQVDLFATRFKDLDPYAFPPAAILGKVVEKLQDYPCNRIILIAPGWPNMPWFWDLVAMSSQIPPCLPSIPNLVSQPFNQVLHRNLSNLNLHAWLLEPQQSRSKASLRQWQHELRLLKEDQPDLSMRQSGPFLQSGASVIRWTSGHHLWRPLLTSSCTCFRRRSYNQALLMATDPPLLTNWAIPPLMSAKMRISLVSWIVSIETDLRAGGASPPGTFHWFYISSQRLPLNPWKRPPWTI